MALSLSVASELLEAFRPGEGVDLIRESVRMVMQELIETEATEQIGPAGMNAPRRERPSAMGCGRGWSPFRPVMWSCGSRSCGRDRSCR